MKQQEQKYEDLLNKLTDREQSLKEKVLEMEEKRELLMRIEELEENVSINYRFY